MLYSICYILSSTVNIMLRNLIAKRTSGSSIHCVAIFPTNTGTIHRRRFLTTRPMLGNQNYQQMSRSDNSPNIQSPSHSPTFNVIPRYAYDELTDFEAESYEKYNNTLNGLGELFEDRFPERVPGKVHRL